MKLTLKQKLERIGEKLGYKTLRYGYRGIPYLIEYAKHRDEIALLKTLVEDDESVKVIDAVIKSNITQSSRRFLKKFVKESDFISFKGETRFHPNHYFEPKLVNFSKDEVFVDAGGYIGDTTFNFIQKTKGQFKKVHIFEASPSIYTQLIKNLESESVDLTKIKSHEVGLYSSDKEAFFTANSSASKIDDQGTERVQLVALDSYLTQEEKDEITFVKMDIEGVEMDALRGMKEMIRKNRPKLAISIYHLKDDLWKIPFYMKELNPDYKLYIRQYDFKWETICYAIP